MINLNNVSSEYIERNYLQDVVDYMNNPFDKAMLKRACIRCCIYADEIEYTRECVRGFLEFYEEDILNEEDIYNMDCINTWDNEQFNKEFEDEIFDLIVETENLDFRQCLMTYIIERNNYSNYCLEKEMLLLNHFGYDANVFDMDITTIIEMVKVDL